MRTIVQIILAGFLVMVGLYDSAAGQGEMGARELALGLSVTAMPNTDWSVFGNPAMMNRKEGGVSFYGVRYYGLSELTDAAVAVHTSTGLGAVGAGVHRYGFDLFDEKQFRLAYKNRLQEFHFGWALSYHHITQGGGYGSAGAVGIDIGIAASLFDNMWIAAKSTNINRPRWGGVEDLPRIQAIGISYGINDDFLLLGDIVKDVRFPVSYRSGLEVILLDALRMRAGVTTKPATVGIGLGYRTAFWKVNVAFQRHQILGISPGLDFGIHW